MTTNSQIGATVAGHGRTCLAVVGDGARASEQAQRSLFELRKVWNMTIEVSIRLLLLVSALPNQHGLGGGEFTLLNILSFPLVVFTFVLTLRYLAANPTIL